VHRISHDPTLKTTVDLADGRKMTGLDVQRAYFEKAQKHVENTMGADVDDATAEVLQIWGEVLDDLARDPMSTADRLDWTAKLRLLEGYRERDGLAWNSGRLALVDLQYTDVRMAKGLYNRLVARGSMKRLVSEEDVLEAMHSPPEDTRAYFRGRRLVGLGDLRPRPRVAGPDPHARAAAGHPSPRRRADRQLPHGRGTGGGAHPRLIAVPSRDAPTGTGRRTGVSPISWVVFSYRTPGRRTPAVSGA
jgi:hypothetical protein